MVIRVHKIFTQQLIGAVGNDLVDIHIRLRAAAGLPDGEREVAVERAVEDLMAGGLDRAGAAGVEHAELRVRARGRELHDRERADDLRRDLLGADAEVFKAALRLRAPVTVSRHTHLAHGIMLQTVFHPVTSFRKNLRCRYYTPICPRTATPETRKKQRRPKTALLKTVGNPSGFPTKGLQSAARRICVPPAHKFHTCSLRSIFSAAHIAGKDDGISFRRSGGETLRGFSLSGA